METRRRFFQAICIVLTAICLASCGDDDDDDNDSTGLQNSRTAMQQNYGDNLIIPAYEQFAAAGLNLQSASNDFAQEPTQANLDALRLALRSSWSDWQNVSLFQFGPAEQVALRSAMNTYPTDDDKIESNVASGDYVLDALDNQAAVGFPAIDYLVNGSAEDDAAILALYATDDLAANRLQYLEDLVQSVVDKTETVTTGWSDSYLANFTATEASGTDVGSTLGTMVNALNLHFERFVRDGKIAIPAGVRSAGVPRPQAVESLYGEYSVDLLLTSLQTVRRVYRGESLTGANGEGMEDYLIALGEDQLASDILQQMDVVIADSQQLTDPLPDLVESNNEQLLALFTEMQSLVILLKTDMPSVMGVSITFQDNDGD